MKKIKHPIRKTVLILTLAVLSTIGGCLYKQSRPKRILTPEEQEQRTQKILEQIQREINSSKRGDLR